MADDLTVVCWKWESDWRLPYTGEHVYALQQMLKAHLKIPHRLVCVTDDPTGVPCETVPLWHHGTTRTSKGMPNCYRRLWCFSDAARAVFGDGHILSIDLDVLIREDITDLIDLSYDFRMLKGKCARYNGSLWQLKMGSRTKVWDTYSPSTSPGLAAKYGFGSDQAWISYVLPNEKKWHKRDGIWSYAEDIVKPHVYEYTGARVIFYQGKEKPWTTKTYRLRPELFREYMRYAPDELRARALRVLQPGGDRTRWERVMEAARKARLTSEPKS